MKSEVSFSSKTCSIAQRIKALWTLQCSSIHHDDRSGLQAYERPLDPAVHEA